MDTLLRGQYPEITTRIAALYKAGRVTASWRAGGVLSFVASSVRYEPYPLVVMRPAMEAALYEQLAGSFPDARLFATLPKYDYKLSLSEKLNAERYHEFLAGNPLWNRFHAWVKSPDFIRRTIDFLAANNIDLEVEDCFEGGLDRAIKDLKHGRFPARAPRLRSRFEFSVLKADGGEVAPHTDTPRKIITLVLSMIRDGEWDPGFGGNLDINRATDPAFAFNWRNRIVPWDRVEIVETVPFLPNQCMLFVKTFNSLHSVRKMTKAGSDALRKTVTIVIERDG